MRRIVVIASGMPGIHCATKLKRRLPEHEVNVIAPASSAQQQDTDGPMSRRRAAGLAEPEAAAMREVGVLEAYDIMPDLEENCVTVSSERGKLAVRYTDLIIEVPATVRLPRALQKAANVFGLPMPGFASEPVACDQALADAAGAGLSVPVVGAGLAALDAVFAVLEAGATAHWIEINDPQSPGLEPHIQALVLKRLGNRVTHTRPGCPPERLVWTLNQDGDKAESVRLPDGTTLAVPCCLWTGPLMGRHPILREDGVLLDPLGRITTEGGATESLGLHLIGSGVAVPDTCSEASGATIHAFPGGDENATASLWTAVDAVAALEESEFRTRAPQARAGILGIREAGTPGITVMRAGLTLAETEAQGLEAEYALIPAALPQGEESEEGHHPLMLLALVCHKPTRTLLGVQAAGFSVDKEAVAGLFNTAVAALADGTPTTIMARRRLPGLAGSMTAAAAAVVNNKLETVIKGISADELVASHTAGAEFFTLDLRAMPEWREACVPGAYSIPLPQLKKRLQDEVPRFTPIVLISQDGRDAYAVAAKLAGLGATDLYVLDGGMALWPYETEAGEES